MTLEPEGFNDANIPRLIYSHDRFESRTKGSYWDWIRGKYLVPAHELRRARVVLLARDPRDAFVSLYVQLTRRTQETPDELKQTSTSDLLRHPAFGIRSIVAVMNSWLMEFSTHPSFSLSRYESLRREPKRHFHELLVALGEYSPKPEPFAHALEFSEFSNMKRLEAAGAFDSKILRAGDVGDPESFKVRRGKVGGFQDYLSTEDQAYAATAMQDLDADFGYDTDGSTASS